MVQGGIVYRKKPLLLTGLSHSICDISCLYPSFYWERDVKYESLFSGINVEKNDQVQSTYLHPYLFSNKGFGVDTHAYHKTIHIVARALNFDHK
jgi:hypothetical protein